MYCANCTTGPQLLGWISSWFLDVEECSAAESLMGEKTGLLVDK
jgi:hypothetical protein